MTATRATETNGNLKVLEKMVDDMVDQGTVVLPAAHKH